MALQTTPATPAPPNASNMPTPPSKPSMVKELKSRPSSRAFWIGLGVSVGWIGTVLAVIAKAGPGHDFAGVPLAEWAMGVSAAMSPVAMVWMVTAYLQRAADIQTIAEPLRRQLTLITGESGAADARIRRFNQAIREQIELLRSAQTMSHDDLEAIMNRVRTHRTELEKFESVSTQQVKEVQDVIRRSMLHAEQMMDDKFTMLRVLDGKLQQNGDGVARQVESVRDQVAHLLEEVETSSTQMADSLERALRDSKKLSDTSRLQESSLTNASAAAAETLSGLSSKIDLSVTRFLERASTAREEAERLASALDAQTRALDDFSNTLPTRVSEAESVLRGVADRLYASEQLAREQAVSLSDKLSVQVDGLQSFLDRFSERLSEIDDNLDRRQSGLSGLSERLGASTSEFVTSWEKSLTDLNEKAENSLLRFSVVNDEARRNADGVAAHLSETTTKYEDVVVRMRGLSNDSGAQMKTMTEEITNQLTQFEALSRASNQAGEEVQERANAALQNLQHVLERVLTAREATQAVGEMLVKDIYAAVDQNEKMIARLNETAQLGTRTLVAATETLGRQQTDLVTRARDGESTLTEAAQKLQQQAESAGHSLREQTVNLMGLLAEAQGQLAATDQKLQSFTSYAIAPVQQAVQQIETCTEQGLRSIGAYGEGLGQQVARLQDFNTRIATMGEDVGRSTALSATAFEQLSERFIQASKVQDETARQTLEQFTDLSAKLQHEITGLDGQAAQAVESLQQAALRVGEQSYQMMESARTSGAQLKDVTSGLQAEAYQIQSLLRQQTEEISSDLARAEQKFSTLGETIRERADAAYALIEQTAAHYNTVSHTATSDMEDRAQKIDQAVSNAFTKVGALRDAMTGQVEQIESGAVKIETHAGAIAANAGRAAQNLSLLNEKMALTHEAATTQSTQTLSALESVAGSLERQARGIVEAADMATDSLHKAGSAFGEQAGRLIDGGQQIDTVLRQLTSATTALSDQTAQIRIGMEQQNARLISQLSDSVAQMDVTSGKLQQVSTVAIQSADYAATRFADTAETASQRIGATSQDLQAIAERTEATLAAIGANVTQQAASLSIVGEQIGEQQRLLASASDNQREQMLDMFDKLRGAHMQASEVAERSITHLNSSLQDVYRQMGVVGDKSQESIGAIKIATMGFSDQAATMLQNAQAAEQQARTVLSVTSALQEQARGLREALQMESERAGESLGALLSRLTVGSADVRELGVNTGAVFTTLQRALSDQAGELGLSMQQINDRQRSLTSTLDAQREAINGLLNRLTLAQDETAATAERSAVRLVDGTQQITRHAEVLEARAQSALVSVQAAGVGFARESEAIEVQARQAEVQARNLFAATSGLHDQVHDLRASMQDDGERTDAMLKGLLDKVTHGASELRDVSASTEAAVTSLGNAMTQQGNSLSTTMQQVVDRQRSLTVALDAQRDVVNGLLNRLAMAQDESASAAERAASRLIEGAQQITQQTGIIESRAQAALASVHEAGTGFASEAQAIEQQARTALAETRAIIDSSAGLQRQISELHATLQSDSERTNMKLGFLVSQVTSGSEEIRSAGASSESTLVALQRMYGEQSLTLSSTLAEIDARQRALTTTVEREHEAVNGLLNRLTLAEDEAVTRAEKTAISLAGSTAQIIEQIDTMGAHAASTLHSVEISVDGFVNQAEALAMAGAQTEQQVRGLLSVTSGLQSQAQHLREAMQVESARIGEQLSTIIAQLDGASKNLKSEGLSAAQSLNQSTQHFTAAAQAGTDMLRTHANMLSETTVQADSRLANADEKVRSHLRLVGEVGEKAEVQARQLADTAEFATTRMVALRDTLALGDKEGSDIVAAAGQRIENLKHVMQDELRRLTDMTQNAVDQVAGAGRVLAGQSDALRSNLAASESALSEAASLVREENAQLPSIIQRSVIEIETATRAIKGQAVEADQALIGTADRFITVTASARNAMADEMQRVGALADDAGRLLAGFGQALSEQVASLQKGSSVLSSEQTELSQKAAASLEVLATTSDRLNKLRSDACDTAERLVKEFDTLDQRIAAGGNRLAQVGDTVVKQATAITEAAARAETQMSGVTTLFRDQLEKIRAGLQTQIEDINRGLMQITAQLERTASSLRSTTVGAVADVERVGQRFDQAGHGAAHYIEGRTQAMQVATDEVSRLLSGFDTQLSSMLDRMATAGAGIKNQQGDTLEQLQAMLSLLGGVAAKIEATRDMSGEVSQNAIAKLDDVVNAVQAHMNTMTAGAQTAAGIMRGINQIYQDQTHSLTKGVTNAHDQVVSMNTSIDAMQERTDRMRISLKTQGDDLMNSLRQILTQLEMTGEGLSEAVDRALQEQAADNLKRMG